MMQGSTFDPSSRTKLTRRDRERFPDGSLFHAIGRVVCDAECLPRKELFEAWEVARRVRRRFRGGRVLDLASGHGLLAYVMVLLDDTSSHALCVDTMFPSSASKLRDALVAAWPRLNGRVEHRVQSIRNVDVEASDLVVSVHACGGLTDDVLESAVGGGARVAALPCCQDAKLNDAGGFSSWVDAPLAIDIQRVASLRARGYEVRMERIPEAITPKNRLILAEPSSR